MENLEVWTMIALLWVTQFKLLYDMHEIKSVIKIEKKACIKEK